jgi:hypothetical protein
MSFSLFLSAQEQRQNKKDILLQESRQERGHGKRGENQEGNSHNKSKQTPANHAI